jgi:RNA polymerase sigma factor (sigma-70 family)
MNETGKLVLQASATGAPPPDRQEAFAGLVLRYQDMAYACAYGVLGDRGLAEDAVQNSLLSAWLNLGRLHEPRAFPGWLRQTVLRHAYRLLREKAAAASLDEVRDLAGDWQDPAVAAERLDRQELVGRLLTKLPEHERVTVLLFYMGEQQQAEIAEFLGISVTAVKQRLHSARARLRRQEDVMIREDLNQERPSRSEAFAARLRTRLLSYGTAKYDTLQGLLESAAPGNQENATWLANRQDFAKAGLIPRAYVVKDAESEEILGYGCLERLARPAPGDYPPTGQTSADRYRLHMVVPTEARQAEIAALLYERLDEDASELRAAGVWCRELSDECHIVELLRRHGFEELHRVQEWHFDLTGKGHGRRSEQDGIEVTTLAEERASNASHISDLARFWNALPKGTVRGAPLSVAEVEARLDRPHIVPEAYFIARRDGRIVGVLVVRRPPAPIPTRPDIVSTVLPEAGGVDEALLAEAAAYGVAQAYTAFTTHLIVDRATTERLERLGFRRFVELVLLEKELRPPA